MSKYQQKAQLMLLFGCWLVTFGRAGEDAEMNTLDLHLKIALPDFLRDHSIYASAGERSRREQVRISEPGGPHFALNDAERIVGSWRADKNRRPCDPEDLRLAGFSCFPPERNPPALLACVASCETADEVCRGQNVRDLCDARWQDCTDSCRRSYPFCPPDSLRISELCPRRRPLPPTPRLDCLEQRDVELVRRTTREFTNDASGEAIFSTIGRTPP